MVLCISSESHRRSTWFLWGFACITWRAKQTHASMRDLNYWKNTNVRSSLLWYYLYRWLEWIQCYTLSSLWGLFFSFLCYSVVMMGQPDILLAVVGHLGATYFSYMGSWACSTGNSYGTTAENVCVTDTMNLLLTIFNLRVFLIPYSLQIDTWGRFQTKCRNNFLLWAWCLFLVCLCSFYSSTSEIMDPSKGHS